jgi:alpha-galactosidase
MKKIFLALMLNSTFFGFAQTIKLTTAKFSTENKSEFKETNFNDADWAAIKTGLNYELQGYDGYNGYSWYRIKTIIPSSIKTNSSWKDSLRIHLGKIDDCDEVYFNGVLISKSGHFPYEPSGYITTWNMPQQIFLATNNPLIHWDAENTIAIKVYDGNGGGGLFGNEAYINMVDLIDGIKLTNEPAKNNTLKFIVKNIFDKPITGSLEILDGTVFKKLPAFTLNRNETKEMLYRFGVADYSKKIIGKFIESYTKKEIESIAFTKYILTPKPSVKPTINTPNEFGIGLSHPFIYRIPATGMQPMEFSVSDLPKGLILDKKKGVITGIIKDEGEYITTIIVKNNFGTANKSFVIKAGKGIALTPPMGWNSWNCWGLSVSEQKVKASAQAMINKGLTNYGWSFINIDDGWEAKARKENGEIIANNKFPNMKGLGDFLHKEGLKFGIYSSPGPLTCGGYLGSYQHEWQDAQTYANWGIDYLKYDWCSYENIHSVSDTSLASFKDPYILMHNALKKQGRDVVYSLCQYGMKEVWKWGASVGGNLWRTTGDIDDTWESFKGIGFSQTKQQDYAKPGGGWNDADMMIVGNVGWGESLHPTRLTPDEQYTHVSLWCLLNNPLLIGCDMGTLDDFTLNLLTNDEVIAIDQNTFSTPAKQLIKKAEYEVWVKQMDKDEYAVGIFNFAESNETISFDWNVLGLDNLQMVRDVWRQKNEGQFKSAYKTVVPSHGVKLIVCKAK